jgi:hypothetical protein
MGCVMASIPIRPKIQIADLIIHYHQNYGNLEPQNLITIQDANSKPYFKQMPDSLISVRQASMRTYGRIKERIRCSDCGARKIPQSLCGGRCEACNEKFRKDWVPEKSRCSRYAYPQDWRHFDGSYG